MSINSKYREKLTLTNLEKRWNKNILWSIEIEGKKKKLILLIG